MEILIFILAIYGFVFLFAESDGPCGIIGLGRNYLFQNKYIGTFFYKLLSCPFCTGMHGGWIIYLLHTPIWEFNLLICWALAGGVIGLLIDSLLIFLRK